MEENCLSGLANNKDSDQPVHSHSPISTLDIRFLKSIVSNLATPEILIF